MIIISVWELMLLTATIVLTVLATLMVVGIVINIITKIYSTIVSFSAARKYRKEVLNMAIKFYLEKLEEEEEKGDHNDEKDR